MLIPILKELYERDIGKLKTEIESYEDESDLWRVSGQMPNSAGNLCLHLIGNLRTYFGAVLAGSGYVRDRDAEFATRNVPRDVLLAYLDAARADALAALGALTEKDLAKNYPMQVFDEPTTIGYFLVHLATHLNYHLGQVNYHRRSAAKT